MAEKKAAKPAAEKKPAAKAAAKDAAPAAKPAEAKPAPAKKAVKADKPAAEKKPRKLPTQHPRGQRRALIGKVKSDKMDKTVVVEVESLKRDAVYGKYLKSRVRYKAHDEKNQYHVGDKVEIHEHRPLSRDKRWIVTRLLERAKVE